jgi:hypothetical protein
MLPASRRQRILNLLAEQDMVRVDALSKLLGVSVMTVHRDLDNLQESGQLLKVRGGAVTAAAPMIHDDECVTCRRRPRRRLQVVLHFDNGAERRACCPHCGLLTMIHARDQITAALVTDFLYEHTISARHATYVVAPDLSLCCAPTVLAFEYHQDALRFQAGFGGHVLDMNAALLYLQAEIHP